MAKLKITLKKSLIGNNKQLKPIARSLGLKKTGDSIIRKDKPEIKGMINKLHHLLHVEKVEGSK